MLRPQGLRTLIERLEGKFLQAARRLSLTELGSMFATTEFCKTQVVTH